MTGKLRPQRTDALRCRGGRPPQQREAVGEIAADHTYTAFTDSRTLRFALALETRQTRSQAAQYSGFADISLGVLGSSALRSTWVGTESRVMKGMYRGARTC